MVRKIYLILFLINIHFLFGQSLEIKAKKFTIAEGLSNNTVAVAVQDSLGFVWIKSEGGLNRFDGYSIKNYFNIPGNSTSLQSSFINNLLVDENNNLWVSTALGVSLYCREKDNFKRYCIAGDRSYYSNINVVLPNGEKHRGFLYGKNGMFFYNNKTDLFEKYDIPILDSLLNSFHFYIISFDIPNGLFWIWSDNDLLSYQLNSKHLTKYNVSKYINNNENIVLTVTPTLSFGTIISVRNKLFVYNKNDLSLKKLTIFNRVLNAKEYIHQVFEDSKSRLWISSANGVFVIKEGKIYHYTENNTDASLRISNDIINQIFEDSKQRIHLLTNGGYNILPNNETVFMQIDKNEDFNKKLTGSQFQKISELKTGEFILSSRYKGFNLIDVKNTHIKKYYSQKNKNSIAEATIYNILEDSDKNLWVSTQDSGFCKLNRKTGKWTNTKTKKMITTAFFDKDWNLWLGFKGGDLVKYDVKKNRIFKTQKTFHGINMRKAYVRSLFQLNKDTLLVGTRGKGLFLFDLCKNKYLKRILFFEDNKPYNTDGNENFANQILIIKKIKDNLFWIGTDYGFLKFDVAKEKVVVHYVKEDTQNSLAGNNVFDIHKDSYNQLWIATYDAGLCLFLGKEKGFKNFGRTTEIKFNTVHAITEDKNKNLWFTTTNGIMRIDPLTCIIKKYSKKDGFLGNEFNTSSLTTLSTGEIAAGGVDGLNIFYPDSLIDNKNVPKMAFTKFLINNNEVKLVPDITIRKELEVDYDNKVITFEFAAFNYTNTEDNKYKYKLEGANDEWVDLATHHSVTFTNLSPDDYVLRVIGSNNDGYWNEEGLSLNLSIIPPFYMTPWFYFLILVLSIIPVLIIVKLRLDKYKMIDKTRSRIAENLHDEFGGKLSSIGFMASLLQKKEEIKGSVELNRIIEKIAEQSHSIADDFRDIVWALNPENDDWNSLLIKYRRFASDLLDANEINYEIKMPDSFPAKELDSEKKLNYILLLKEITNNILKHSKAENVIIEISFYRGKIKTIISDNGIGFKIDEENNGNGIINIKKRLKILKAQYKLNSNEKEGTRWKIIFKY